MTIAALRTWSEYLSLLEDAGDLPQLLEDPHDEQGRAEIYRQLQMNLSLGYFLYFGATAEHPDWVPFLNSVFMLQPNPDDAYLFAKVAGNGRYRLVVERGNIHLLTLDVGRNMMGMSEQPAPALGQYDLDDMERGADGRFEILLYTLTDAVARRMRKRIDANPEGRHGEHVYTLEQFGLSAAMIRERLADYRRRYQIE